MRRSSIVCASFVALALSVSSASAGLQRGGGVTIKQQQVQLQDEKTGRHSADASARACNVEGYKGATPNSGPFHFSSASKVLQGITVKGGESFTRSIPCGASLNLYEIPTKGWTLVNIACSISGGKGNFRIVGANRDPAFQPDDNEIDFDSMTPGSILHCDFRQNDSGIDIRRRH